MNSQTSQPLDNNIDNDLQMEIEIPPIGDLLKLNKQKSKAFLEDTFLLRFYTREYLELFYDFLNQVGIMSQSDQARCIEYPSGRDYEDDGKYDGDFASGSKIFDRFIEIYSEGIVYDKAVSFTRMYFDIIDKNTVSYLSNTRKSLQDAMRPEYLHNIYKKLNLSFDEEMEFISRLVGDKFAYRGLDIDYMREIINEEIDDEGKNKLKSDFQENIIAPYLLENISVINTIIKEKNAKQEELELEFAPLKEATDIYKSIIEVLSSKESIKLNISPDNLVTYPISNESEYQRLRNQLIYDLGVWSSFCIFETVNKKISNQPIKDLKKIKQFTTDGKDFDQFEFIQECSDDLIDKNDAIYNKNEYDEDGEEDINGQIENGSYKIRDYDDEGEEDDGEDEKEENYDFDTEEQIVLHARQKLKSYYELGLYMSMDSDANPCLQIKLHRFENIFSKDGKWSSVSDLGVVHEEYPFYFDQRVNNSFHEDFVKGLESLSNIKDINSVLGIQVISNK